MEAEISNQFMSSGIQYQVVLDRDGPEQTRIVLGQNVAAGRTIEAVKLRALLKELKEEIEIAFTPGATR